MHRKILLVGLLFQLMIAPLTSTANTGFPGRAEFPEVPVYKMAQLYQQLNNVVVVDARSHLEYETLRIKGALNIPVASKSFEDKVKALRNKTNRTIVFYCNGRTCYKSYHAVKKSQKVNIKNIYAYDAGMFEWAKAYPQHSVLLGKSPINPRDIIPKKRFKARLLDPDTFGERAYKLGTKSMVLDVRDKYQRGAAGFFPGKERWASLDDREKLNRYIREAVKGSKTLFIYDEVGKQVRWLQYALEKSKVKDYYFMKKGAKAYYKQMLKDLFNSGPN